MSNTLTAWLLIRMAQHLGGHLKLDAVWVHNAMILYRIFLGRPPADPMHTPIPAGKKTKQGTIALACSYTSARLAQSVERKALNLVVVGSSPTVGDPLCFVM